MFKRKFGRRSLILAICAMVFTLSQCTKTSIEELGNPCDLDEIITYNTHIAPIVSGTCAVSGCHVAGGNGTGNFTQGYSRIKQFADQGLIRKTQVEDKSMPPSGLSDCDSQLWEKWLDQGALEE